MILVLISYEKRIFFYRVLKISILCFIFNCFISIIFLFFIRILTKNHKSIYFIEKKSVLVSGFKIYYFKDISALIFLAEYIE